MKLEVTYVDGEPTEIIYSSMVYGLMKFQMDGSTAVIDDEWDQVNCRLADGFEQKVYTEDVVESVEDLPFVEEVAE